MKREKRGVCGVRHVQSVERSDSGLRSKLAGSLSIPPQASGSPVYQEELSHGSIRTRCNRRSGGPARRA